MRECYILGLSSDLTSEPEARAQCGSAARWDLCGGRPEPDGVKGRPYRDPSEHRRRFHQRALWREGRSLLRRLLPRAQPLQQPHPPR